MKNTAPLGVTINNQPQETESPFISMHLLHRFLIIGVVGIYLVFVCLNNFSSPSLNSASEWVLLALTTNLLLLLVPVIFYRTEYGWFHPLVFGIFTAIIDHLRRTSIYINGLAWHKALPGWNIESLTFLVAYKLALGSVGLIAYYCGFFFSPRLATWRVNFSQPRHLERKMLLIVLFSLIACLIYIQSRGGISAHILSWGGGRRVELAGQFYWQYFIQFGAIACLIWLAIERRAHFKPLFWVCAVTSIVIIFLAGGARGTVIYFIIFGLLVWMLRERKIDVTKLIIAAVISLLLLGVLGNFRQSTFKGEINWNTLLQFSGSEESALGSATDELEERSGAMDGSFPILALVPDEINFLYGSSYLAVVTLPIPRGFWPGKPGLVGGRVGETFFGLSAGVPCGAIGEAYWNFGIFGVLLVFFLFGACHKWLAQMYRKYASESATIVLYILTLYQFDPSGPGVESWLTALVPAIMMLYVSGVLLFRRGVNMETN